VAEIARGIIERLLHIAVPYHDVDIGVDKASTVGGQLGAHSPLKFLGAGVQFFVSDICGKNKHPVLVRVGGSLIFRLGRIAA
jgi:hypothetical protein